MELSHSELVGSWLGDAGRHDDSTPGDFLARMVRAVPDGDADYRAWREACNIMCGIVEADGERLIAGVHFDTDNEFELEREYIHRRKRKSS